MKQKVPVAKGEEIETDIVDLAYGGDSIAKYGDFTIFLPYGVPGARVCAKILDVKKNFATGRITKVIKQSQIYENPQCPYFGECGGCDWMNVRYKNQVEYKKKIITDMVSRIAGINNVFIRQPIIYENPFYYRNRAQYKIKYENKKIKIGFFRARSHEVIAIDKCMILNDKINEIADVIENSLNEDHRGFSLYSEENKKGYLRYITVKVNSRDESLVTFVVTDRDRKKFMDNVSANLIKRIEKLKGIVLNLNRDEGNAVFGKKDISLYGKPFITESFSDIDFLLGSASFFQINFFIYEKMADYVNKNVSSGVNLLDLYGGVGALTVPLKDKVRQICVVDNERSNIDKLRNLCSRDGIKNVFPVCANAEDVVEKILYEKKIDEVVVDPPRKGLHPVVLFALKNSGVRNIIYVSCNPSTFARDVKELKEKYYLKEIIPLDQFAHTYHVELMAKLERKVKN